MGLIGRLLAASLAAAAVTAAGIGAMYVTAAPKFVSLAIEPVSLLLLPGTVASLAAAGPHDFSTLAVAVVNFAIYFAVFLALLTRWSRRRSSLARRSRRFRLESGLQRLGLWRD